MNALLEIWIERIDFQALRCAGLGKLRKMHRNFLTIFGFFQLFLVYGIDTETYACGDLERDIKSREEESAKLKLQLEEYKLADDDNEDVLDECNAFTTCNKCLREKNACGWCFLRNRCSLKEHCPGNGSPSNFWIPNGSGRCPKIRAVKPHLLPATTPSTLQIDIPHMPQYGRSLVCVFEMLGGTLLTKGKTNDKGISCPSPRTDKIAPIPEGSYQFPVQLSVRTPHGPNIVSTTNFTIYECRRYKSCYECTSSPFPCAWCNFGNKCTHDEKEYCRNDVTIFSKEVPFPTLRQGPSHCSQILPASSWNSNEILVPNGLQRRISVKIENAVHQVTSRFECKAEGQSLVNGQLLGDMLYCDTIKFKVLHRSPMSNLTFNIFWGNGQKIDNPHNLHVVVYQCSLMASSCSECLELPEKYNCGWCGESDSCSMRDNCAETEWLEKKHRCTKPEITSFTPKAGLLTRPTNITIKGVNLGNEFSEIDGGVKLINEDSEVISECRPYEDEYVKFSQIVCQLEVPEELDGDNGTKHGFIEVKVFNDYITISEEEYFFVDPSITEIEPVKGIKSGGTYLTVKGQNLHAGSNVEVFIGDLPCNVVNRDSSNIRCITSPSPRTRSSAVRVIFDGEERLSAGYFFYVEDPYVSSARTEIFADGPTGTPSGGNLIIVEGEYFDYEQNPYIYIIVCDKEYPGPCAVESPTRMRCSSPRVPSETLNFGGEEGFLSFDYGFRMGNVEDIQNISMRSIYSKFRMHPDPFFEAFTNENRIKVFKPDNLVIKGRNLDSLLNENDIKVEIGADECLVTSLSRSQLTCKAPPVQPEDKDGVPNKLPEVVVKVRELHEYFIGFLRYDTS